MSSRFREPDWGTFRSEPLLAAKLNDQCGTCARRFEVYVYSGQPFVEGNRAMRVLLDDHAKTEHSITEETS